MRADCAYSHTGEGLHRFVDPVDDRVYLYTQFEVPDARRVFTTFEQPDLKAVFTFTVDRARGLEGRVQRPHARAASRSGDGKAVWRFPPTERMSTYITALDRRRVPRASTTPTRASTARSRWATTAASRWSSTSTPTSWSKLTKQGFEFFEEAFDFPYPFEQVRPALRAGVQHRARWRTPARVTLRDEYLPRSRQDAAFYEFRCSVILHEMAHMWFGDLVTMKWWDDLWLNESFAEWACYHAAVEATEFTESWTGFTNARKNWA